MLTFDRCLPSVFLPRIVLTTALALAALLGMIPRSAADQAAAPAAGAKPATDSRKSKVPPFAVVESVVARELAKKPGYKTGDLITRSDVAQVAPQLEKLGFQVRDVSKNLQVLLPDDHLLAQLMRSLQGDALAAKIKNLEVALDRMDRLCNFPEGQDLIRKLVVAPNALEVIEQLCLPETAKGLAAKYPNEPACQTLDIPSGRAFTERQYLERLRTFHTLAERGLTRPGA